VTRSGVVAGQAIATEGDGGDRKSYDRRSGALAPANGSGRREGWRHPDLPALGLGVVLAIGVCWPLLGGGRTFLLDWVVGPHTAVIPDSFFGLNSGLTTGMPMAVAVGAASHVLGPSVTWIPIALIFPIATTAMSRLVGGSVWARMGAATLFAVNPFVFQRLFVGHVALLLGYALLPLVLRSMLVAVEARGPARLAPVLWMALVTALSPHFAWITGVLIVAVIICRRRHFATARWGIAVVLAFAASMAYVFLPPTGTTLPITTATSGLRAFQTTGDPHVGLFGNVVGLYGFWRLGPGPTLPKSVVSGWLYFLAALLVVAAIGAVTTLRSRGRGSETIGRASPSMRLSTGVDRRVLVGVVLVSALVGFFLALGGQGPTGLLFRWAFNHVPFFDIMREPEKFSMLVSLGYATCFGIGVEHLVSQVKVRGNVLGSAAAILLAVGLPLAYVPTIFNGLNGQISSSELPGAWGRVQTMTADRSGALLFLPWHEYLAFPFTQDRVIANPAPSSFTGDVIAGSNAQLVGLPDAGSPQSAYIEGVLDQNGAAGPFGTLMAPLGVEYIALAKTVDWRLYGWLSDQSSLEQVYDSPTLELWKNLAYGGLGKRGAAAVTRLSPVAYRIPAGVPGYVDIAIPYEKGWTLNGVPARATPEGTVSVLAGRAGGVLRFDPWHLVVGGDVISVTVVGTLGALVLIGRRRRNRRYDQKFEVDQSREP
jgi:hypothetical protein